ncbi:hypothetical protein [Actinomadura madurae]|uniref:hypothetical protein n=1 Tax=Actinomadura madurae TaxID=1993 RepID=UPI0020266E08|nr:hypothetical protein [Actinomadura madurae]MCP9948472.1 hypothetical protein [Actinomadura madurae]MCP9965252.1 hypothetical protein [Actinomadura madurae]MCQ0010766.1 hypothetical protein [Actinomadura madurae]MCQ0013928.1 hypothetical protein [Actinomadura madurae]URN04825.1 hypothetical protein LUW74_16840 [Actinomadura madurae]
MADDRDERQPLSWRVRRWAGPLAMAVAVAASIGAVRLLTDEGFSSTNPLADREPRFLLTVWDTGDSPHGSGRKPWLQVRALRQDGRSRPVDSVRPPASAGKAQEIIEAPGGTFVVSSLREDPCESRLYRFGLTGDGQVEDLEPLGEGGAVPARVAGLAMSPDGARLAFTTAPCTDDPQAPLPPATVTVLDIDSNDRRTWTAAAPSLIGEIAWARDGRTLGYALSDVRQGAPAGHGRPGRQGESTVENVTVHALDTRAEGADLGGGRILFRQPGGSGAVTTAVMNPDGRTGLGVLKRERPATTVFFSFAGGGPMRVTRTIEREPNTVALIAVSGEGERRYACLGGIDSFGRVTDGAFTNRSGSVSGCGSAYAY